MENVTVSTQEQFDAVKDKNVQIIIQQCADGGGVVVGKTALPVNFNS